MGANDRARRVLSESGALSDRGRVLSATGFVENDGLQRLLARALPPLGLPASAGSMTIARPNARTRLTVHVTPVTRREWDLRAQRVAALVLIADPASRPRIDAGLVAEVLNLTPAESRLATMLAAGRTVREIAATGRTEGTVRWHLKRIFRKQGISRQADLVRRVLSLEGFPRSRRL
ncbi:MAG: helix-turn-helix transcriptional regulator [Gammaproteobacteria bacterium]|nr:helix-turn-helix transcriptional regulator [Gammaproteobacteria bacterium]MYC53581.1 helix-turn-helix transcriptional regulator [Gammaproteobacteria bacterium]